MPKEIDLSSPAPTEKITRPLLVGSNINKLALGATVIALVLGLGTGYVLSSKSGIGGNLTATLSQPPKTPQQDTRTFRDFAEGTIKSRPQLKDADEYIEGTHFLEREGTVSVALTSSVVDLSLYEGKKVKVFGETQKAIKEGWLMDVGKVEEIK